MSEKSTVFDSYIQGFFLMFGILTSLGLFSILLYLFLGLFNISVSEAWDLYIHGVS